MLQKKNIIIIIEVTDQLHNKVNNRSSLTQQPKLHSLKL